MAKIKEVSSYNGSSWDTPVPLGVNDANVDITSSTTNPSSDTTATSAGLVDSNVTVTSGDTGASAWTKFNRFRKRVQNAFGNFAGVTLQTAYSTANTNTSIYTTGVINNYMNNVIGYTGTTIPNTGTVATQLNSLNSGLDNLEDSLNSKANFFNTISADSLKGKKISIIGDSISTYDQAGYKIDRYSMYYPTSVVPDVDSVDKTWWKQILDFTGAVLEKNASDSGSCVSNVKSGHPSLYDRCSTTIIGRPDIVMIVLGTNDSTNDVPIGDYDYTTAYDLLSETTFANAYIKGVKALQARLPDAKIICVSLAMKATYQDAIDRIADTLGCVFVNAVPYQRYVSSHPNALGMKQIATNVLTSNSFLSSGISLQTDGIGVHSGHAELYNNVNALETPSSAESLNALIWRDRENRMLGQQRVQRDTSGAVFFRQSVYKYNSESTYYENRLNISSAADGKPAVAVYSGYGATNAQKIRNAQNAWQIALLTPQNLNISPVATLPSGVSAITHFSVYRSGYLVYIVCDVTLSAAVAATATIAEGLPKPVDQDVVNYITPEIAYSSTVSSINASPLQKKISVAGAFSLGRGYAGRFAFTHVYMTSDDPIIT